MQAGALPTLALGLMEGNVLEEKLGKLPEYLVGENTAFHVVFPDYEHRGKFKGGPSLDRKSETAKRILRYQEQNVTNQPATPP